MQSRSTRALLAISATLALSVGALAPSAAFGASPGGGAMDRDGTCTNEPGAGLQVRARAGAAARVGGGAQSGQGGRNRNENALRGPEYCDACDAAMGTLSEADIAGLVYMANEEKMAHDVYATFATMYDVPVFERIAESETRHQLAVDAILERYDIADETSALSQGVFSDPQIQQLHDQLIARGSASLAEAIAAGVLIEQTDIADLEVRVAGFEEMTSLEETAPDVFQMYSSLLAASGQHLAAFQRQQ
jgi:hypothetical protein